ncbi:hypothetical protein I3843_05G142600 [Carya illinoinensis]|uniref:Uncharacterized protein n=1 Tax=Carya illinoinensis TaxID=32201 RepID=A0A922JM19_CARIL|nr:hypothetical protein I3842_05G152700 [Carya illinoinensis]KAG7979662.1 hypothetical protein I3843_05G142600 [Carya illinoinensis]
MEYHEFCLTEKFTVAAVQEKYMKDLFLVRLIHKLCFWLAFHFHVFVLLLKHQHQHVYDSVILFERLNGFTAGAAKLISNCFFFFILCVEDPEKDQSTLQYFTIFILVCTIFKRIMLIIVVFHSSRPQG